MDLQPTPSVDEDSTLAGAITRALAARIVAGAIAPGTKLRQDHIATEFRTSHVPVREAFRRLEARGLAVSEPRRGVRVAPLDPAVIHETTVMRASLETLALEHALPRLGPGDLALARTALAEGEASADIEIWEAANRRFHQALTAPCAMRRLIATIDDLQRASARYMFACWRDLDWQRHSAPEHHAMLAAITAGDGPAAVRMLGDHITAAGQALIAAVQSSTTPPRRDASRSDTGSPSITGSKSA